MKPSHTLKKIKNCYYRRHQTSHRTSGLGRESQPAANCLYLEFSNPAMKWSSWLLLLWLCTTAGNSIIGQSDTNTIFKKKSNPRMYLGDSAAFTFPSSNQRRLDFCPNQWKKILSKDTLMLRDRKFKWVRFMRELSCVRAPPSRLEADSHFLSNSAERCTGEQGFFVFVFVFLNSSLPPLFTLLEPVLLHSARRLDGQKGVLKVEKEKANVTVEIVFRDALGISYKDNISFPCQYPYWFYPRGNWAECAHLWKHPDLTSNLCYFKCNVSSSSCNSAGGGDGGSLTGSLIRHGESSYLAALERIVPKARPHMESFCQARGVLGDGGN